MARNNDIKILVVDDEEIVRELCSKALTKSGYPVTTATNGQEAVDEVRKGNGDIVLLDLKMSLMDGLEALEIIKRESPHVEVIIITGFASVENAIEAMKKGAYDFLLKPLKPDQIRMVVERCAKKISLTQEVKELKKINEKLRELQIMKDKFVAITSHELRTPVTHIKSYLDLLKDDNFGDDEKKEFLEIISASTEDLENIVMDMHDIAQMESNTLRLKEEKVSLQKLIDQTIREFKAEVKQRKLSLRVDIDEQVSPVTGDRFKLKRAISELVQNSIKYTPDNGSIAIRCRENEELVAITIADTGIGIPENELSNIFEKFYEVQNTDYHHTSKTGFMGCGTGLGLTLARSIVEAHNGRIKVESTPGTGSRFTIYLSKNRKSPASGEN